MKRFVLLLGLCGFFVFGFSQTGNYSAWDYSGSFYVITTPDGANLPDSVTVSDFPVMVRLTSDFFDFSRALPNGNDIRFSSMEGMPLSFQVEDWDPGRGQAVVWVRIPEIRGNEMQEVRVYWGNPAAESESNGPAVFNESNGFISVWHLNSPVADAAGRLESVDFGSADTTGVAGPARIFKNGAYIHGGDSILGFPSANNERTTSAWIFAKNPGWAVDWGREARCQENSIKVDKPPVIKNEGYLCDAFGKTLVPYNEWHYASITYKDGDLIVYLDGEEDGRSVREFITPDTSYLRIGKRHDSPDNPWGRQWWNGAIDEVRISGVARSPEWIRLEYENQKPLQTLTGPLVVKGDYFSLSHTEVKVNEGIHATVSALAEGAAKIYWIIERNGIRETGAVDQLNFTFKPGRIKGDETATITLRAIYPNRQRTRTIPVTMTENIPDPVIHLSAPVEWNGRDEIEVGIKVVNKEHLMDKSAAALNYKWEVSDIAVSKVVKPDRLILKRAHNSGVMRVGLTVDNGGEKIHKTIAISVVEPDEDPWIVSIPEEPVEPVDNQFYGRDDNNQGTVIYKGVLNRRSRRVILRIYAGDQLFLEEKQKPEKGRYYVLTAKIDAGLVKYRTELWAKRGSKEIKLSEAGNILCGDAYIINGQSNAEANDYGRAVNPYQSEWARSFGSSSTDPEKYEFFEWGDAVSFDKEGGKCQIGYWGMELAKILVEKHNMPVCIINGAVGGSRIDQHQRNSNEPEDLETIYGRLLRRVRQAGLNEGIRAVLWHQGENDQGADGPDEGYGWENYRDYFIDLAGSWKEDYPNIRNYYIFQIWPDACSMGRNGSGDMLREVQRTLPSYFSNLGIMSTLGIRPGGGCHFPSEGYARIAELIAPVIEKDHFGIDINEPVTPPNLVKAYFTSTRRDEIALEFDQPMDWNNDLSSQFYLDGEPGWVEYGSLWGNKIVLQLRARSNAEKISYLDGKNWDENNILYGRNWIAALTFFDVTISDFNGSRHNPATAMRRSPVQQPYSWIVDGSFSGKQVPESPDPLISYRWPDPQESDSLEIFTLAPVSVDCDTPGSFEDIESLTSSRPKAVVKGPGSIRIDFGVEMPAWIEFDSPDCPGGVEMSISEYNQPGINKTAVPVRYGNTWRLELNDELYDGVRFAWIHVKEHTSDWNITGIRAVNQVKPTNYEGSFRCSDQLLTRVWYTSAYSVKASLCQDYFGAILMDRGDRMSWTGDAHPSQAASLVAFGNYDFVRRNLENTAGQNNGIRSYSLYWVLSLIDYYKYTGDRETLEKYIDNACAKLDEANEVFGTDPNLRFYGWDERLTAGFELWFKPAPEAQKAYQMLTIRTWLDFASVMGQFGRTDLQIKYTGYALAKMAQIRSTPEWFRALGLHSSADAITTGLLAPYEEENLFIKHYISREKRLSLSPFNQYFIIQALGKMKKHDDALSTVRDLWGGMILNGATTTYEVFRPSWNDIIGPNDPVPNSQSGIVSLCHPWGAGPVKWINEEILGIKPAVPGFEYYDILPHPGRTLEWMSGSTPTPYGTITAGFDVAEGKCYISSPEGTNGLVGIPKVERSISTIKVNGKLAWDGSYHRVKGIAGASEDADYVYLISVQPGSYDIDVEYAGTIPFYVEPHYQYLASYHGEDTLTSGSWEGVYGKDGYVLCNYLGGGNDKKSLPSYVRSIEYFRAFPKSEGNLPENTTWESGTSDKRALSASIAGGGLRNAAGYTNTDQTMTFTADIKGSRNFQIALYFVDWEGKGLSQAVEMFDAETLNLISPVKMVDDYSGGKYLIFSYNKSVKFRINKIRGEYISLSGIFFDPVN